MFSYITQYRAQLIIQLFVHLIWTGFLFTTVEIIFSQTSTIVGWTKPEVYLLTVFWLLTDELFVAVWGNNISCLSELTTRGTLDSYITKPTNTLFLVSNQRISFTGMLKFFTQCLIAGWLFLNFDFGTSPLRIAATFLTLLLAISIDFSLTLMGNTLSFWFSRIENINSLIGSIHGLGRYPLNLWPRPLKIIFLSALPIAFSGYIPLAILTGKWPLYSIVYVALVALIFGVFAHWFWQQGLKKYSSASS